MAKRDYWFFLSYAKTDADRREILARYEGRSIEVNPLKQLNQLAETVFAQLSPEEQIVARRVFTRLVRVAQSEEVGGNTRQRIRFSDVSISAGSVVQKFCDAQLLLREIDPSSSPSETVQITHDDLLQAWERLQTWISEDREFLLWRQRLRANLAEWERSRDEAALLGGAALAEAERWVDRRSEDLILEERLYIQGSRAGLSRQPLRTTSSKYTYDVFISFSSADRPWALKLYDALKERGFEPFLDHQRLDIGKPWEPALARAVQTSQHFIVLWSNHAEESRWVRRELGLFESIVDPAISNQPSQEDRRFIFLMLEGENPAYTSMQMLSDLREANVYAGGADAVDPDRWQEVIKKLVDAMRASNSSVPLPVAVLAMTQQDLAQFDPNEESAFGPPLNTLLHNLGIGTVETLAQYYGDQRMDWRPFGGSRDVQQILNVLLDNINISMEASPFRWEYLDPQFWTNMSIARREREKLLSTFSVVVIDPLSLYDPRVYERLVLLSKCFESEKTIILTLTPFLTPAPFMHLSQYVEQKGSPFFDEYYNPPVSISMPSATIRTNISDERELKRILYSGLDQFMRNRTRSDSLSGPSRYLRSS